MIHFCLFIYSLRTSFFNRLVKVIRRRFYTGVVEVDDCEYGKIFKDREVTPDLNHWVKITYIVSTVLYWNPQFKLVIPPNVKPLWESTREPRERDFLRSTVQHSTGYLFRCTVVCPFRGRWWVPFWLRTVVGMLLES